MCETLRSTTQMSAESNTLRETNDKYQDASCELIRINILSRVLVQ